MRNTHDFYKNLQDMECPLVVAYFMKNWHPIRHEWVSGLQGTLTLGNRTNNRVESINQKIMQIASKYESLPRLFSDLMALLTSFRIERDQHAVESLLKAPALLDLTEDESKFAQLLTPYCFKRVRDQLRASVNVNEIPPSVTSTTDHCTCPTHCALGIPCRHMFHMRKLEGLPAFSVSGVAERWTKAYYAKTCRLTASPGAVPGTTEIYGLQSSARPKILSEVQKYKKVSEALQQLASRIAEQPMAKFEALMTAVKQFSTAVENGSGIVILECPEQGDALELVPATSVAGKLQKPVSRVMAGCTLALHAPSSSLAN